SLMSHPPPGSLLFPYTTLFRSGRVLPRRSQSDHGHDVWISGRRDRRERDSARVDRLLPPRICPASFASVRALHRHGDRRNRRCDYPRPSRPTAQTASFARLADSLGRKVASDAVTWPQLAQFGVLDVAEAHLRNRAPGMEMASGREVDEIRRLPGKRLADD